MRFIAVLFVAFACSGAFTAEPQIRQATNADFNIQEWNSPIAFDLDASWLRTLPFKGKTEITNLPTFYCDSVTLNHMQVTKSPQKKNGDVEGTITVTTHVRKQREEKIVEIEFSLLNGDQQLLLGRIEDLEPRIVYYDEQGIKYKIPNETFAAYTADGSAPKLRVSLIVLNK